MDVTIDAKFTRQPLYYNNFACIGASCPQNCCYGWGIIKWTKEEVEKLKSAECSEEFRELIDKTFVAKEGDDSYIVKYADNGYCPLQDENGLCRIQKEFGIDYMSHTCMIYPRMSLFIGNTVYNYCYLSCYHILDTLCSDKDCMKFETSRLKKGEQLRLFFYSKKDFINYPALKYCPELFEFLYNVISDESRSIQTSVVLGSLAVEKINEFIVKKEYDRIPGVINALKPQLNGYVNTIENLETNYGYKIQLGVSLCINLLGSSDVFKDILAGGGVDLEKYIEGEKRFKKAFADRPFAFRNIACNLFLECKMPFRDKTLSLMDNYLYFTAALAAIMIVAPAVYMSEGDRELKFKETAALLDRAFTHNDGKVTEIVKILKEFGCTDHSHIAALLK